MNNVVNLGREADEIIHSAAYVEAMRRIKERVHDQWAKTPTRDIEGQQLLLQMRKVSDIFEETLSSMVSAGKDAQVRMDMSKARKQSRASEMADRLLHRNK